MLIVLHFEFVIGVINQHNQPHVDYYSGRLGFNTNSSRLGVDINSGRLGGHNSGRLEVNTNSSRFRIYPNSCMYLHMH
jgi:hypothetical protein